MMADRIYLDSTNVLLEHTDERPSDLNQAVSYWAGGTIHPSDKGVYLYEGGVEVEIEDLGYMDPIASDIGTRWGFAYRYAVEHGVTALAYHDDRYSHYWTGGSDALVVMDLHTGHHLRITKKAVE
jgi:hypothetical protein